MGSRDKARGEKAVAEIVKKLGGDCKDRLELIVLDTSSDASVKEAAQGFEGSGGNLDGIINNAGVSKATRK